MKSYQMLLPLLTHMMVQGSQAAPVNMQSTNSDIAKLRGSDPTKTEDQRLDQVNSRIEGNYAFNEGNSALEELVTRDAEEQYRHASLPSRLLNRLL